MYAVIQIWINRLFFYFGILCCYHYCSVAVVEVFFLLFHFVIVFDFFFVFVACKFLCIIYGIGTGNIYLFNMLTVGPSFYTFGFYLIGQRGLYLVSYLYNHFFFFAIFRPFYAYSILIFHISFRKIAKSK